MFWIGVVMFALSTVHLGKRSPSCPSDSYSPENNCTISGINCYRMVQGYVVHAYDEGGAAGYIGNLRQWHHILKDTIFVSQTLFGDAVAVSASNPLMGRWCLIAVLLDLSNLDHMESQLESHILAPHLTACLMRYVEPSHKLLFLLIGHSLRL